MPRVPERLTYPLLILTSGGVCGLLYLLGYSDAPAMHI